MYDKKKYNIRIDIEFSVTEEIKAYCFKAGIHFK